MRRHSNIDLTANEFNHIVNICNDLKREYPSKNSKWKDSPFKWILSKPSRTKGTVGEKIVSSWLALHDFNVERSPDSEADRVIERKRVEIKFSTLWENGSYRFQQLRDQNYDFAIFLGLSPLAAHCWVVPKTDILTMWKGSKSIPSQHGGKNKGKDTSWVHLSPDKQGAAHDEACGKYGNDLHDALVSIAQITKFDLKDLSESIDT